MWLLDRHKRLRKGLFQRSAASKEQQLLRLTISKEFEAYWTAPHDDAYRRSDTCYTHINEDGPPFLRYIGPSRAYES